MTKLCLAVIACVIGCSTVAVAVEALEVACKDDYLKYCTAVRPGGGRVVACLSKETITKACRESVVNWIAETKATAQYLARRSN
jgi:hypothetical protein